MRLSLERCVLKQDLPVSLHWPDLALCMASEGPSCTTGVTCPALGPLMVQVTEQMCDQFMERDEML